MIDIRADFPTASRLTYLNTASISLMPPPAVRKMRGFDQAITGGGTVGFDERAETEAREGASTRRGAPFRRTNRWNSHIVECDGRHLFHIYNTPRDLLRALQVLHVVVRNQKSR